MEITKILSTIGLILIFSFSPAMAEDEVMTASEDTELILFLEMFENWDLLQDDVELVENFEDIGDENYEQ